MPARGGVAKVSDSRLVSQPIPIRVRLHYRTRGSSISFLP